MKINLILTPTLTLTMSSRRSRCAGPAGHPGGEPQGLRLRRRGCVLLLLGPRVSPDLPCLLTALSLIDKLLSLTCAGLPRARSRVVSALVFMPVAHFSAASRRYLIFNPHI